MRPAPTTCTRRLEWDAAHRVLRHESKCATLHGHHYTALITCIADQLDDKGRVVDFGVIKERVGGWIDRTWDHATLVNVDDEALRMFCVNQARDRGQRPPYVFPGEPTAEVIAAELARLAEELLADTGVRVAEVTIFETPNCSATVTLESVVRLRNVRVGRPPGVPSPEEDADQRVADHRSRVRQRVDALNRAPLDEHTADTVDRTQR